MGLDVAIGFKETATAAENHRTDTGEPSSALNSLNQRASDTAKRARPKKERIRKDRARPARQRAVAKSKPSKGELRKTYKGILGEKKRRKRVRKRPRRAKKRKSNVSNFSGNSPSGLRLESQKPDRRDQLTPKAQSKFAPPRPQPVFGNVHRWTGHQPR